MRAQSVRVARIQKIDGPPEIRVFDPLVMRQVCVVRAPRSFDMPLQPRPTRETAFTGDGQVRIAEAESRSKDLAIGGIVETRMKLPDPLRPLHRARRAVAADPWLDASGDRDSDGAVRA